MTMLGNPKLLNSWPKQTLVTFDIKLIHARLFNSICKTKIHAEYHELAILVMVFFIYGIFHAYTYMGSTVMSSLVIAQQRLPTWTFSFLWVLNYPHSNGSQELNLSSSLSE
jgi:hypothetical protein